MSRLLAAVDKNAWALSASYVATNVARPRAHVCVVGSMHLLFALSVSNPAAPTYTSVHAMTRFPFFRLGMRPTWQTSCPDPFRLRSSQESSPRPVPNQLLSKPLCPSVQTGTIRPPRSQQDFSIEFMPASNAQPMSAVFQPLCHAHPHSSSPATQAASVTAATHAPANLRSRVEIMLGSVCARELMLRVRWPILPILRSLALRGERSVL